VETQTEFEEHLLWRSERPRWTLGRFVVSWLSVALAVLVAGIVVPGFDVGTFGDAPDVALLLALLNAALSPCSRPYACRSPSSRASR
jgi:hypothetical protein